MTERTTEGTDALDAARYRLLRSGFGGVDVQPIAGDERGALTFYLAGLFTGDVGVTVTDAGCDTAVDNAMRAARRAEAAQ